MAKAYQTLSQAMQNDLGFAQSWQANIAMAIYDSLNSKTVEPVISIEDANRIADRLMAHLFGVRTSR